MWRNCHLPFTILDEKGWYSWTHHFTQQIVGLSYSILPINAYFYDTQDWVQIGIAAIWRYHRLKMPIKFPFTVTLDICKLYKTIIRQEIRNEVQKLTTQGRNINNTCYIVRGKDDEEFELPLSSGDDPGKVVECLDSLSSLLKYLKKSSPTKAAILEEIMHYDYMRNFVDLHRTVQQKTNTKIPYLRLKQEIDELYDITKDWLLGTPQKPRPRLKVVRKHT